MATAPKAIPIITMRSEKEGILAILAEYFSTLSFNASTAELSALSHLSISFVLSAPYNRNGIQRLATKTSTISIIENCLSKVPEISFSAAWLAPPPIQLPATVDSPLHIAPGESPPNTSGVNCPTM